jgi:zinc/manganese transport system substrate-binding protein
MHRRTFGLTLAALALASSPVAAGRVEAQLKVVTSSTDLYDIARAVGGSRIRAAHIGEGYQDPHFVEAKPSFILQLRNADVFAFVGLDLESGWMPLLVNGARNSRIRPGGSGYVDVSRAISVLDIPQRTIDRSQGDVHPLGNPHYWLDPDNGKRIAHFFRQKFTELDPKGADVYEKNTRTFDAKIDALKAELAPQLASIRGKPVVAWHTSWRYFAQYTGMNIVAFMEPKPGVPPSPAHLAGVIGMVKRTGAKVIVMEPFYDRKVSETVAKHTGAKVLILPTSVGGTPAVTDYFQLLRHNVAQLATAVR